MCKNVVGRGRSECKVKTVRGELNLVHCVLKAWKSWGSFITDRKFLHIWYHTQISSSKSFNLSPEDEEARKKAAKNDWWFCWCHFWFEHFELLLPKRERKLQVWSVASVCFFRWNLFDLKIKTQSCLQTHRQTAVFTSQRENCFNLRYFALLLYIRYLCSARRLLCFIFFSFFFHPENCEEFSFFWVEL